MYPSLQTYTGLEPLDVAVAELLIDKLPQIVPDVGYVMWYPFWNSEIIQASMIEILTKDTVYDLAESIENVISVQTEPNGVDLNNVSRFTFEEAQCLFPEEMRFFHQSEIPMRFTKQMLVSVEFARA